MPTGYEVASPLPEEKRGHTEKHLRTKKNWREIKEEKYKKINYTKGLKSALQPQAIHTIVAYALNSYKYFTH